MIDESKNSWLEYIESEEYQELIQKIEQSTKLYDNECDVWWEDLTYEEKLKAFHSVVKRIVQAELKDKGTYRWALYNVFGFGPDAYSLGMDCGYMDLHNSIYTSEDIERIKGNKK